MCPAIGCIPNAPAAPICARFMCASPTVFIVCGKDSGKSAAAGPKAQREQSANAHLDLVREPRVHGDAAHLGDVRTQRTVDARAVQAEVHAEVGTGPGRICVAPQRRGTSAHMRARGTALTLGNIRGSVGAGSRRRCSPRMAQSAQNDFSGNLTKSCSILWWILSSERA